jgi:hypothetical protein
MKIYNIKELLAQLGKTPFIKNEKLIHLMKQLV